MKRMGLIGISGLLLVYLLGSAFSTGRNFDARLKSIVSPYSFSIVWWEARTIPQEINRFLFHRTEKITGGIETVTEYFSVSERIETLRSATAAAGAGNGEDGPALLQKELKVLQARKTALAVTVEKVLKAQIRETLAEQGIFNPVIELKFSFPPLNFKLEKLPYLLVISPRERIESMREIILIPSLALDEMTAIEDRVDGLDVSSLVVELGGLGTTYPTLVSGDFSLRFTIDAAVEEWLHQYLAFKPLGFCYLLDLTGLSRNYEIATMNETAAGMVSKEIGSLVYQNYYSEYEDSAGRSRAAEGESAFDLEMRETRKTVDAYLDRGEIKQAEEFMEQKRQYLASLGYHIRKLNQAYFAFHGAYADKSTSVSPIGLELKKLREQSVSLKDFLDTVAGMTNRQQLEASIK